MITDEEKMRAMREAGMSYRKIADVFGCSTTRVVNAIDPTVSMRRNKKKQAVRRERRPKPEAAKVVVVSKVSAINTYLDGDRDALSRWLGEST